MTSSGQGRRDRLNPYGSAKRRSEILFGGGLAGSHGSKLWNCRQLLMESYLYVAKQRIASVLIIVQLRLVFNRFFYFLKNFSERKSYHEQIEKQYFRGCRHRADYSL